MSQPLDISVVIPMLNEQGCVRELLERLLAVLDGVAAPFEIVVVDDGSSDDTPEIVRAVARERPEVRMLRMATNFGQEAAVQAGMLRSSGRWVIQLDGDLQHPPEEIPKLLALRSEGYEIIYGTRQKRKDPWHRVAASKAMVFIMRNILGIVLPDDITTFRVIDGDLARMIARLPEKKKFFSALAGWAGAHAHSVPVKHSARQAGHTKYNLSKLISHMFDLMVGFSVRPLRIIGGAGALFALVGIAYGVVRIVQKLIGVPVNIGYTSIFSAVVIMGGLNLVALSVIGEYVGRLFIQAQDRPLYRVVEAMGFADASTSSPAGELGSVAAPAEPGSSS